MMTPPNDRAEGAPTKTEAEGYREVLTERIHSLYTESSELGSGDPSWLARAGAEPRLRPQARLRRLLRTGQTPAIRAGVRHPGPAGSRRKGGRRTDRAGRRTRPQALLDHRSRRGRSRGLAGLAGRALTPIAGH